MRYRPHGFEDHGDDADVDLTPPAVRAAAPAPSQSESAAVLAGAAATGRGTIPSERGREGNAPPERRNARWGDLDYSAFFPVTK